ncbi:MAG: gluconate:H+ symporter, partial [Acidobacteriota bacterium]
LILFLLLYLKLHPFLSLIISGLVVAFVSDRIPLADVVGTVSSGFAGMMGQIGILLVMASIIGKCLVESGAADKIIRSLSRLFGKEREEYAFLSSSFFLSMPVFFDTVFYLLAPLVRIAYARRKRDYVLLLCAATAGGAVTHALVPPTPGPIIVSQTLGVSLGSTFLIGILVSVVPASVCGILYARFMNSRITVDPLPFYGMTSEELEKLAAKDEKELPSLFLSLLPIVFPIFLIAVSTIAPMLELSGLAAGLIKVMGDTDTAFLIGAASAVFVVVWHKKARLKDVFRSLEPAITEGTVIAFVCCGGGAFGKALAMSGVGELIATAASDWGFSLLFLSFITAALIRIAQGSATVAMITTAGIVAPALAMVDLPFHPAYLVGAIGFGASTTSWMNDSGFWIVSRLGGLTESETLKIWTVQLTLIAVTGFAWVWILTMILPFRP